MNNQIICKPLESKYIKVAVEMAQENYNREQQFVTDLGYLDNRDFYQSRLEELLEHGNGCIAFQNDEPVGFLAFSQIFDTGNGIMGATAPLYGYGIRCENRGKVIGHLFQETAAKLCERYAQSLRINVYAHDTDVLHMYIMSSFSMDLTEVVRNTSREIPSVTLNDFKFTELNKTEALQYRMDIIELHRSLINHLRVSPVFYPCKGFLPIEDRFEDFLSDDMRIFSVFDGNQLVGMIDAEPTDIDWAKTDREAIGMGDVFIKPKYRGQGLGAALLAYANKRVRESGIERVLVTHGTINPNARGFWDKYFDNYAYTMTRRINSEMLGIIEEV